MASCCLFPITLPTRGNALLEVEDITWVVLALDLLQPGKVVAVVGPEVVDAAVRHVNVGPLDIRAKRQTESLGPRDDLLLLAVVLPGDVPLDVVACLPVEERRSVGRNPACRTAPAQAPNVGLGIGGVRQETAYGPDRLRRQGAI